MDEKEKEKGSKLERFEPEQVSRLYDTLTNANWALRAFGALLESADLEMHFCDTHVDGSSYRWGLNQIVELYLDHQERKLDEFRIKTLNSPEALIKSAETSCEMIRQGCWNSHEVALEHVRRKIKDMNMVISEFGLEEYPKAGEVLEKLLELQKVIISYMNKDKVKKTIPDKEGSKAVKRVF